MSTEASGMQKYHIEAIKHQMEFLDEIWHFESQCIGGIFSVISLNGQFHFQLLQCECNTLV